MIRRGVRLVGIGFIAIGLMGILPFRGVERALGQNTGSTEFRVGEIFPTTVFPSLDGDRPRSIADFRGKKLILHIFASW